MLCVKWATHLPMYQIVNTVCIKRDLDCALSNALQWLGTSEVILKLEQRSTKQAWEVTTVYWEIFVILNTIPGNCCSNSRSGISHLYHI